MEGGISHYETLRIRNIEDNKKMLSKLMSEIPEEWKPKLPVKKPSKSRCRGPVKNFKSVQDDIKYYQALREKSIIGNAIVEIETPPRYPNGYFVFAEENRKIILGDSPGLPYGRVGQINGALWKNLSKCKKQFYNEQAKRITKNMIAQEIQQERQQERQKQEREQEKKSKDRMAYLGFTIFKHENRNIACNELPSSTYNSRKLKIINKLWINLTKSEKQVFIDRAKQKLEDNHAEKQEAYDKDTTQNLEDTQLSADIEMENVDHDSPTVIVPSPVIRPISPKFQQEQ